MRLKDISGQKFGRLTVSHRITDNVSPSGIIYNGWMCNCDCGETIVVRSTTLTSGLQTSCGCVRFEKIFKDLTGMRFGLLTAEFRVENSKSGRIMWSCKCDCGQIKKICGSTLRKSSKSCGCLLAKSRRLEEPWLATRNRILYDYKLGAKRRDLNFELTDEQCFTMFTENCHYCGTAPSNLSNIYLQKNGNYTKSAGLRLNFRDRADYKLANFLHNGIDRRDPTCGYTVENCVTCCKICNIAKKDMTEEEFKAWVTLAFTFQTLNLIKMNTGLKIILNDFDLKVDSKTRKNRKLEEPWIITRNKILSGYKYGAKSRNLSFSLTDEDCYKFFKSSCFYCGMLPFNITNAYLNKSGTFNNKKQYASSNPERYRCADYTFTGIDRKNSTLGYALDNCVPCCHVCNWIKNSKTEKEFLDWINLIGEFQRRLNNSQ